MTNCRRFLPPPIEKGAAGRALLELPGEDSNLGCQDQNLEC
jgi:hypothetical protein